MRGRQLAIAVAGLFLFSPGRPALAEEAPPVVVPPATAVVECPEAGEPGPSGLPCTAPARPSQVLPLQPSRTIEFTVDEATGLQPDLAPDGRTVTFSILGDIYTLPSNGGTARPVTRGMAMDTQPAFSPDGRWIAFLSDRSGAENLWVMRSDGSGSRQVSFYDDDPIFASPAWSADGKALYASRYWPDRNAFELWRFALADGMGEIVLPNRPGGPEDESHHALGAIESADGKWLYYAARVGDLELEEPMEWQIVRRPVRGGEPETLVKAIGDIRLGKVQSSAFRPAVSRDGRLLAYAERRTGKTRLRLRDLASGTDRELIGLDPDSLQAAYWSDIAPHFAFTPDDRAIVFTRGGKLHRIALADGRVSPIPFTAQIAAELGPLTRAPTRIQTGLVRARIVHSPALSPDGTTFAFSALGRIYTMPAAGGAPRPLAANLPPQFHPSWSPDGKRLAFVTWTGPEGGHVWEADAASGKARRLTTRDAFYTHPAYGPGGELLVVRSSSADRRASYVEFGQFRDAQLVRLADGEVLASGTIGGTPHFLADGTLLVNRSDGVYRAADNSRLVGVVGPNWYFAEGSAHVDDLRLSPDGRHALAQIAQQLHLVTLPRRGEEIDLSRAPMGHEKLTEIGADFFGWSTDGNEIFWSIGSTLFRRALGGGPVSQVKAAVTLPRDTPSGCVLLTGATVLTMGSQGVIADADVLIDGDRVSAVGRRGSLAVPPDASRRDLAGKFVIPGLIDIHDHVADIRRDVLDFGPWGPAANLAYGVTSVMDPSTLTIDMLAYQDAIDAGLTIGSRIFSTGTALFAFNDFRSRNEVASVVRRYREHYGLSNIKMYRSGNRRVRQWIAAEALAQGIQPTTEGALAAKLDLSQILDGFAGIEHAIPPPILYDDVVQLLARSGTSYDTTLQITHGGYPAQDFFIARDTPHDDAKYARFAPAWFRDQKFWQREWRDPAGYLFPQIAASALKVKRAGGLVAIGAHGEVPGLGTHWEMEAHQMGGWTPIEVLEAATIGGAKAIGRSADLGSLEPGKLADLVVLNADPRQDIANARAIAMVMKGGRLYKGDTLEQLWPEGAPSPEFDFSPPPLPAAAR